LIALVVLLAATAGTLYLLASAVPSRYRPTQLSTEQRHNVAFREFAPHTMEFGNNAQLNDPYTWTVTERKLNRYLASIDEIAAIRQGHKPGEIDRKLQEAGVSAPMIAFGNGELTVMVRTTKYNKIVSADISFRFVSVPEIDHRRLAIRLEAVRVGRLPIPKSAVRSVLEEFKSRLVARAADNDDGEEEVGGLSFEGVSSERAARLLQAVVAAIDEKPIDTEVVWPVNKKYVRIDGIEIKDSRLTLHVTPTRR
jgi:hypothetical protein